MRSNHPRRLLWVVFCLHAALALGQQQRPEQVNTFLSSDDGYSTLNRSLTLSLHGVWDMHQDRQGFMWFGGILASVASSASSR